MSCSSTQAVTGQEESVEALLQRGASVCVRDILGRSPLHLASACGRVGVLGALLQAGSNSLTHLTDNQGYTPLHWACYYGGGGVGCTAVLCESTAVCPFLPLYRHAFSSVPPRIRRLCGGVVGSRGDQEDQRQPVQPSALCRVRQRVRQSMRLC